MKICFDARAIVQQRMGIGAYAYNIIKNIVTLDKENTYAIVYNYVRKPFHPPPQFSAYKNVRVKTARLPNKVFETFFYQWKLPFNILAGDSDVLHVPDSIAMRVKRGKCVVTIHDLLAMRLPELFPSLQGKILLVYAKHIARMLQYAHRIITISENSKQDIQELLGVAEENITVIPYWVDHAWFTPISDRRLCAAKLAEYNVPPKKFVLFVGRIEKRKNLLGLLRAWHALIRVKKSEYVLIICGTKGPQEEVREVVSLRSELSLEDDVLFLEYVAQEDLPYFYNAAEFIVYPSFYEGFGLPPLEAMACRKAVITSNVSSLPEVVGTTQMMVDPYSVDELLHAMRQLLDDYSLRATMEREGYARSQQFTWEKAAAQTLNVYRDALNT